MKRFLSRRGYCARIIFGVIVVLIFTGYVGGSARGMATYHIGNSLTWDARICLGLPALACDAGLELTTGYHIRCNGSLYYIADNPDDVCVEPNACGTYVPALENFEWDAITIQPFSGSTLREEYLGFKSLVQRARQNPDNLDARYYLYASWDNTPPAGMSFYDDWYDPTDLDPEADLIRNAKSFQWIFDHLSVDPDLQGVEFQMIPVGDVLAEVDQRMRAGQIPGFTDARELYRDVTHLNNFGRFIASNTFLATLFGRNPTGTPMNSDFDSMPGQPVPIVITPELGSAVQQAAWEVVSHHPLSGVLPGDLDCDGFVGISDLNLVLGAWNQNVPPADAADPSGDGSIGIEDLNVVLGNWNVGTPPALPVPEPESVVLILIGTLAMIHRNT